MTDVYTGEASSAVHSATAWVADMAGIQPEFALLAVVAGSVIGATAVLCAIGSWMEQRGEGGEEAQCVSPYTDI